MLTNETHSALSVETNEAYYRALLAKNSRYDGVFFVGVRTTGVFCRPTCPARKPRFENCEFFSTAQAALLASYRPCKRCRPLSQPSQVSDSVRRLVEAVEADPAKRWTGQDFRALEVDASTARRQFKRRFGMTFVAYARARRIGLAMKQIREGESVIGAQLGAGYDSGSGFRDAFAKIMGAPPTKADRVVLKAAWLDTPLGPMLAVTSDDTLYLLEFTDRRGLEREVERLRQKLSAAVVPGRAEITTKIEQELNAYFAGDTTALHHPARLPRNTLPALGLAGTSDHSPGRDAWLRRSRLCFGQVRSSRGGRASKRREPLCARCPLSPGRQQ